MNDIRLFLILACTIRATGLPAQVADPVYEVFEVEQPPSFPGGEAAMLHYIVNHLHAPAPIHPDSLHGSVIVLSFIVDTVGQVTEPRIVKDMGQGFGQAAIQVLQRMPAWLPGRLASKKVRVRYSLPIRIRLD